jgi:hypothetical protein
MNVFADFASMPVPASDDVPRDEMLLAEMIARYEALRIGEVCAEVPCYWCAVDAMGDEDLGSEPAEALSAYLEDA